MTVQEAIVELQRGARIQWKGNEVRLANGELQIKAGSSWASMTITPDALFDYEEMERYIEIPILEYKGRLVYNDPCTNEQLAIVYASQMINFKGFVFQDGHIGAHHWCVKNKEIYRACSIRFAL